MLVQLKISGKTAHFFYFFNNISFHICINMRRKFFIHNVTYQPYQIYIDSRLFTQVHIKTLCLLQKWKATHDDYLSYNVVLLS